MIDNTNSLLAKGNKALQEGRYDEAIDFYHQAMHHFPAFERSISFNIALAETRKNSEGITETIFRREINRYIDEAKQETKLPFSALVLTSDENESRLGSAYNAAEILDELVSNVVISCFKQVEGLVSPLVSYAQKRLPIVNIRHTDESYICSNLLKTFSPDLVFYCGPKRFISALTDTLNEYGIPLILIDPISTPAETETTSLARIDFRKLFIEPYQHISPYLKLKHLVIYTVKSNASSKPKKVVLTERMSPGKDIVLFWKQNDTGLYGRRSDMVAKYLASRKDIRKVLIIDTPISQEELNAKRHGGLLTQDRDVYLKTYERIFGQLDTDKLFHHVYISRDPISYDQPYETTIKNSFSSYKKYLEAVFLMEGIHTESAIFWFYPKNYFSADIIETFRPHKLVVDVVDDHRAWPGIPPKEKEKINNHYKDILTKADLCIANCQGVADAMKEFNSKILVVPNGCDDQAEIIEPLNNDNYHEIKEFEGKILGFVGNLESKIDIPLLEKLAETFTDALIVLVGSTHANPKVRDLQKYPNIRFFGVVEYKYINAIVKQFTAGIVPHLRTPLTETMNPLKVFVYASNRLPVVCSDIDNLPQADFIHVAKSHEDFISHCQQLLANSSYKNEESFTQFIETNSWRNRLGHLVDQL